jgi:hypothetical protein
MHLGTNVPIRVPKEEQRAHAARAAAPPLRSRGQMHGCAHMHSGRAGRGGGPRESRSLILETKSTLLCRDADVHISSEMHLGACRAVSWLHTLVICMASSRVGATTTACTPARRRCFGPSSLDRLCSRMAKRGTKNASVLPDPGINGGSGGTRHITAI